VVVTDGKKPQNAYFSSVAATFEKAITYVFAERLIRNAEVEGSNPFCSTINHVAPRFSAKHPSNPFSEMTNTVTNLFGLQGVFLIPTTQQ
jgi:hypothetical protein